VKLVGERAVDAGGPYNEIQTTYAEELQMHPPLMDILCRTHNGDGSFVLKPSARSDTEIQLFEFLGKLFGVAIRTKNFLSLNLNPLMWKLLAGGTPMAEDLSLFYRSYVQNGLGYIGSAAQDDPCFDGSGEYTFEVELEGGSTVELVPGGAGVKLSWENRDDFCRRAEAALLHQFDDQVAAVRRGLATVVPLNLVYWFSGQELERMVTGESTFNIPLLRSATTYQNCAETDPHIQLFWRMMEEMSDEDRFKVLRFASGLSRLPLSREDFAKPFTIATVSRGRAADRLLPFAHTCGFQLDLPEYSSMEVMRERMSYVMACNEIDGDQGGGDVVGDWGILSP
jgi:hypothetical protein